MPIASTGAGSPGGPSGAPPSNALIDSNSDPVTDNGDYLIDP